MKLKVVYKIDVTKNLLIKAFYSSEAKKEDTHRDQQGL